MLVFLVLQSGRTEARPVVLRGWKLRFLIVPVVTLLVALGLWLLGDRTRSVWPLLGFALVMGPLLFLRIFRSEIQQAIEDWLRKPRIRN